jgi:hypothetical protein
MLLLAAAKAGEKVGEEALRSPDLAVLLILACFVVLALAPAIERWTNQRADKLTDRKIADDHQRRMARAHWQQQLDQQYEQLRLQGQPVRYQVTRSDQPPME